jgi:hypothetical protein
MVPMEQVMWLINNSFFVGGGGDTDKILVETHEEDCGAE